MHTLFCSLVLYLQTIQLDDGSKISCCDNKRLNTLHTVCVWNDICMPNIISHKSAAPAGSQ